MPLCACGSAKEISYLNSSTHLMQFLMGRNDTYENLRNQILVLDPLPSIYKGYSMALRFKKQKEVQINFSILTEVSAMLAKFSNEKKSLSYKPKTDYIVKNGDTYCNHCKVNGHTKEACFKLNSYPNWYKDLKDKKKSNLNSANMEKVNQTDNNPLYGDQQSASLNNNSDSMNALFQQFSQFMKANQKADSHSMNFSHFGDFAGIELSLLNSLNSDNFNESIWILDTGATFHFCSSIDHLKNLNKVYRYTPIFFTRWIY